MFDEKIYLQIQGFANDVPTVISDGGNELFKMTSDLPLIRGHNPLNLIQFEHAIVEIDQGRFDRLLHYHKGRRANHLLRWRDRFFVIGKEAYSINPSFDPLRGRAKYERGYYGLMFIKGVNDLFGDAMPEEINAFLAHPPGDLEHADALRRSVHGKWTFEVNGVQRKLNVIYTNTFDEIVGGVHNTTDGVDGQPIKGNALEGNGPAVVFDLGGGSLDLAYIKRDLSVDYDRGMPSIRIGIGAAIRTFKSLFDSRYKKYLTDAEDGISRELVMEAFMDQYHIVLVPGVKADDFPNAVDGGIDCTDIYDEAVNPVIRVALQETKAYTRGFVGLKSALVNGGAASLLLDKIRTEIFAPFDANGRMFTTDQPRNMIGANANGGRKIVEAMKVMSRQEADRWLKAQGYGKPTKR